MPFPLRLRDFPTSAFLWAISNKNLQKDTLWTGTQCFLCLSRGMPWEGDVCFLQFIVSPFFTQISGRNFLPELFGEVHHETGPLQAVRCDLCSTEQSTFWGKEKVEKVSWEGEEGPAKGAKRKKRTCENRSVAFFWGGSPWFIFAARCSLQSKGFFLQPDGVICNPKVLVSNHAGLVATQLFLFCNLKFSMLFREHASHEAYAKSVDNANSVGKQVCACALVTFDFKIQFWHFQYLF